MKTNLLSIQSHRLMIAALLTVGSVLGTTQLAHASGKNDMARHEQRAEAFHQRAISHLEKQLNLQPNQKAAWDKFVTDTKPPAHNAAEHEAMSKLTTPERLQKMTEMRETGGKRLTDAVSAFYPTLSAEQKKTFDTNFERAMHRMHDRKGHEGKRGGKGERGGKGKHGGKHGGKDGDHKMGETQDDMPMNK